MHNWNILKAAVLGILLLVLLILYSGRKRQDYPAIIGMIILSIPGVFCLGTEFMPVIFIGITFTAFVLKKENSIFYTLILYIFTSSLGLLDSKDGIFFLITGILISLLPVKQKERKLLWYSFLLVMSADIIILLVNSNFSMEVFLNSHPAVTLASVLVAVLAGGMAGTLFQKRRKSSKIKENIEIMKNTEITKNTERSNNTEIAYNTETSDLAIDSVLREDFELYKMLKASEKLYHHANRVASISESAALAAGLNEKLARAGGLYHEIGRLKGKDYVPEGITLAREYHLPEIIVNIISSHNLKTDKPSSPEGAVVMLTVSLDAAKDYFLANRKKEEKETILRLMLKFTENLFAMRLEKDSLMNSNLTVAQYIKLKNYYLDYFGKEEEYIDTEF